MTTHNLSPPWFSTIVAIGFAGVTTGTAGMYSQPAFVVGVIGAVLVIAGVRRLSRSLINRASAMLAVAPLVAGFEYAPPVVVLVSLTTAVLAWDTGNMAVSIATQLGRHSSTIRIEGVHLAGSLGTGIALVGIGTLLFESASGVYPVSALVFLIIAAVMLLVVAHHGAALTNTS